MKNFWKLSEKQGFIMKGREHSVDKSLQLSSKSWFSRTLRRTLVLAPLQITIAGCCVANAFLGSDEEYETLCAHSQRVKQKKDRGYFESFRQSGLAGKAETLRRKTLTKTEETCLLGATALLGFRAEEVHKLNTFHHQVEFDDPVIGLRGRNELLNTWWFLGSWFSKSEPKIVEIFRPTKAFSIASDRSRFEAELLVTYETKAEFRMGPFSTRYNFPSSLRILIQEQKIARMEHRWWNGPLITSSLAESVWIAPGNPHVGSDGQNGPEDDDRKQYFQFLVGKFFEASRRVNGFMMASVLSGRGWLNLVGI